MGKGVAQKILSRHIVEGRPVPGEEIALKVDQTLTQDITGTLAYLQFELMGVPKVRTQLSVSYVDHNTLQTGPESRDDHVYLQTVAAKYGIVFSRPGNGICHQVHLERFGIPGKTLLGSDSHTPTAGGLGMLGIGVGGLDVAVAMAGGPFYLEMPRIVLVRLTGRLKPWVSAKDVILELLRRLDVSGGVGKLFEYGGPALKSLAVPERATITNMGAELGATSSVFPSDEQTRRFLTAQQRARDWKPLVADRNAEYDEVIEIDLGTLVPLVACPHSPGNVQPVRKVAGTPVDQVAIGSCTNSSYSDLMLVARMLRGKTVHPNVNLVISPGSRQVLEMLAKNGALADIIAAGARVLENACGPCIGMGQAPCSRGVTVRTFNRNFKGRSGTANAQIYLASPATAAATALAGKITDPRRSGTAPRVSMPRSFLVDDSMLIRPPKRRAGLEVRLGPNIKPVPRQKPLASSFTKPVLLKVGDNISTDDIMPAGAKILPLRSNVPAISEYVFSRIELGLAARAKESGGGIIVGGENYGQGSSREHAALAPMYLGVKAAIAKSFARIHRTNLVNFGLLPLLFVNPDDYKSISQWDKLRFANLRRSIRSCAPFEIENVTAGTTFQVTHTLSEREVAIVLAGGLLNHTVRRDKR